MRDTVHLVFTRRGVARLLKSTPVNLNRSEYAVRLVVEVPDSVFALPPMPTATLSVPAAAVIMPTVEVSVAGGTAPDPCSHDWTNVGTLDQPNLRVCIHCGAEHVAPPTTAEPAHE